MMHISLHINGKFIESVQVQQIETLDGWQPGPGEARYRWAWTEDTGIEGKGRFVVHQGELTHERKDGALHLAAAVLAELTGEVFR